ncbi:MAG TPA: tetratricopeptide repeat protein, partial [Dokdonella sp.]
MMTAAAEPARAQLAANAQYFATAMDHAADAGAAAVARAIGGGWAEQSLMIGLANLSAAMDAPALADRQWARAGQIAQQRGDHAALGLILSGATQTTLSLGAYERCITLADRLLELSRRRGDPVGEAVAEGVLGVVARRLGHLDEALRHAERALELQRGAGNAAGAALVLGDLSVVYRDRGDFSRALDSGLEAVALREHSGDKLDNAYRNVALLYREIEDAATARTYFERALDAAAKRGAPSAYATVVGSYASFLNDAGESSRA